MDQLNRRLDFSLRIAPDDLPRLRSELATSGRVRIEPALAEDAAAALAQELAQRSEWALTWRQGSAERELDAATLAKLSPAQCAALEQFARAGDEHTFRFMHDAIRVAPDPSNRQARGWLIDRLVDDLNAPEILARLADLTGEPVRSFRGDATRYRTGHFLTTHNDGRKHGKRVAALVINLVRWHIDWGGLMLFHDAHGDATCGWTPRYNAANLFLVPQDHSVTWVNALAPHPRIAVAGWFYAD